MLDLLGYLFMAIGMFCSIVGALGIVRFPDVYVRVHAATVSNIGGATLMTFGLALASAPSNISFAIKAALIGLIIFTTSPVGSHAIIRAAYRSGVPLWPGSVCDKLKEDEKGGS